MKMYNECRAVFSATATDLTKYFDRIDRRDEEAMLGLAVHALIAMDWRTVRYRQPPRGEQVKDYKGWYSGEGMEASLKPQNPVGIAPNLYGRWTPKYQGVEIRLGQISLPKPEISTAHSLKGYEIPEEGLEAPFNQLGFRAKDYSGIYYSDWISISQRERDPTEEEINKWSDD